MKKRIISLIMVLVMIFICVPQLHAADGVSAKVTYRIDNVITDTLSQGHLTASIQALNTGEQKRFIAAVIYSDKNGEVIDFAAKVIEPSFLMSAALSLDIPESLESGSFVKTVFMEAASLCPVDVDGGKIVYSAPVTGEGTEYDGIFERYYTIEGKDGSIVTNGAAVTVGDEGTSFRLKNMGEGYVGFADSGALKRRLYNDEGTVTRRIYGFGGTLYLWKLEPLDNGKYYISHYSGGYMAIKDGAVVISETPYEFALDFAGESPVTLITSLEGFKLLSEKEKQRVIEICTSVGAGVFPNGSNANSLSEIIDSSFTAIYNNRGSITAEEQKARILEAVATTPLYMSSGDTNVLNDANIDSLPGGGAKITRSSVKRETIDIWDTGRKEYNRIDVTYSGFGHTQKVKFYYDETGETNVEPAIEALARFPYEYRQFITQVNVYVPASGFMYNCDGPILTVRVANGTNVEAMARNFAHELGHSIEFLANGAEYTKPETHWCQSAEWQQALIDDIATVSKYANSNSDEGLAEFARLYFECYGNRDRMVGLRELYPNRYASFVRLLNAVGMETLY